MRIVETANQMETLSEWRNARVQLWLYHVTHCRMALSLSRVGEREALYVLAAGCRRVSGPLQWENADISILGLPPEMGIRATKRIIDAGAGFELWCSDIAVAIGDAVVPCDPFEDLLEQG